MLTWGKWRQTVNTQGEILLFGVEKVDSKEARPLQKLKQELAALTQRSAGNKRRGKPYFKIETNGCWSWQRAKNNFEYGVLRVNSKDRKVHRYFYEKLVGKIKRAFTIDHLCENKVCCNPAHLEQVTHRENLLRYWKRKRRKENEPNS